MNRFLLSLLAALVASAATAGGLFYQHRSRNREAAQLRRDNGRMRFAASLARQQARVAAAAPAAAKAAVPAAGAPKAAITAASDYRNEGAATPLATLQTFAWASDRGDVEAVGRMICFDPAARTKAEAVLAAVPAEARARWKTVDDMAAELLTSQGINAPFPGASILAQATIETVGDDRVRLRLPGTLKDNTEYQRTPDGWKYVITEEMVDDYVRRQRAEAQAGKQGG